MATTVSTLLAYCEQKTQAGTGNLNRADGISFLNEAMLDFRTELIKRGVDAAQTQESYVASVTPPSSGNGSTFAYPSDMYLLKTISVTYDGLNYIQAQQIDVANTPNQNSFEWLRLNQDQSMPLFDDRGDTYEIFPAFQGTPSNPIRIFYYLQPTPYSSTSDTLNYPDNLDWYLLAGKVAALYYESLNKFNESEVWTAKYLKRVEKMVETLAQGSQQPLQSTPLQITGWEF
jgi:hypothetical protein